MMVPRIWVHIYIHNILDKTIFHMGYKNCPRQLDLYTFSGAALKNCALTTLDLTCNRIQSEGFLSLVKALKDTDTLKTLKVKVTTFNFLNFIEHG